ncbi:MAG TPA: sugar ABC transporter permease [Acetobacteraceae bacterium]|nr:sugar ABC transporter permease [Acetobacteraceae bacterium]
MNMHISASSRQRGALAVLAMPAVLFTAMMVVFPILYTIWLSFRTAPLGHATQFVGFANYAQLADSPQFWNSIKVSLTLYVISLAMQLTGGTYLALLLFQAKRMPAILRSILISPFMVPPVVVGMMFLIILDPSLGAANWVLSLFGIAPSAWLASPEWVIPTVALIDTWQWMPFVALIVLGGLQSLPPSVYEAAKIDGAPPRLVFWRITLPLLLPTLATAAILRTVDLLRFFDIIYVTTQGGPLNASDTLNIYGFHIGFELFQFGYASALAMTLTAMVFGVVLALNRLRRAIDW